MSNEAVCRTAPATPGLLTRRGSRSPIENRPSFQKFIVSLCHITPKTCLPQLLPMYVWGGQPHKAGHTEIYILNRKNSLNERAFATRTFFLIFSRPRRSQGLLYKHLRDSFIHSFINSVMVCENIFTAPPRPNGWRWGFKS